MVTTGSLTIKTYRLGIGRRHRIRVGRAECFRSKRRSSLGRRHWIHDRCTECVKSERGSVLPLLALVMVVLLGCAGLAVDVRNGYVVRAMLQHAVDDGAISAQRWSVQVQDTPGAGSEGIIQGAEAEALQVVEQELRSQGVLTISNATASVAGNSIVLAAQARVPTFFAALFGLRYWAPHVEADAPLWTPAAASVSPPDQSAAPGVQPVFSSANGDGNSPGEPSSGQGSTSPGPSDSPAASGPPGPDRGDTLGPCNCDGIAAGTPEAAAEALGRMGATPGSPGPFAGDLTSEMGLGAMQEQLDSQSPPDSQVNTDDATTSDSGTGLDSGGTSDNGGASTDGGTSDGNDGADSGAGAGGTAE
jgi:hypothetical protein